MKRWTWIALLMLFVVGAVLVAGFMRNSSEEKIVSANVDPSIVETSQKPVKVESKSLAEALGIEDEAMVEIGGIKRPRRDVTETKIDLNAARDEYLKSLPKVGSQPSLDNETNPTVAKLAEELNANPGIHPVKSVLNSAEAFDRGAYLKDKKSYLGLTRPGRVFQALKPDSGVAPLSTNSIAYQQILQGESVSLEVKAEPGMPVTFHTQQLGEFENRLKTISVEASDTGIAKATYRAVSGVKGMVRILAASPVHSRQLKFVVDVSLPDE